MQRTTLLALACATLLTTACGERSRDAQIALAINNGLAKESQCMVVPVGIPLASLDAAPDSALAKLISLNLVTAGKVTEEKLLGKSAERSAYIPTEAGTRLVQRDATNTWASVKGACFRTGVFEIKRIEAVDLGNDATGKPIATVRARVKFVPEEWISDTRKIAAWAAMWRSVSETEGNQYLYQLLQSGDEFFFTGRGAAIK